MNAPISNCTGLGNELLGPAVTIVVALVSLCAGVITTRLNSQLELRKTLCLRKVEVYEAAGRFGPLAESEYNQQQAMLAKLKKEIAADKQLKKLFR